MRYDPFFREAYYGAHRCKNIFVGKKSNKLGCVFSHILGTNAKVIQFFIGYNSDLIIFIYSMKIEKLKVRYFLIFNL